MKLLRASFLGLVLANLLFFAWAQGYFGGRDEGREPQHMIEQLQPERIRLLGTQPPDARPTPVAQIACRSVEGLEKAELERLRATFAARSDVLQLALKQQEGAASWWVLIPALANKAVVEKKSGELNLLGISEFKVLEDTRQGGFVISFGQFGRESEASEFLAGLGRKGVRSARFESREKGPDKVWLEVRGPVGLLAKHLPEVLAGMAGTSLGECR